MASLFDRDELVTGGEQFGRHRTPVVTRSGEPVNAYDRWPLPHCDRRQSGAIGQGDSPLQARRKLDCLALQRVRVRPPPSHLAA